MKGKTSTGFEFDIDAKEVANDWELVELLCASDEGDYSACIKAMKAILGVDGYNRLKEHVRGQNGKVAASAMKDAFMEVLTLLGNDVKN